MVRKQFLTQKELTIALEEAVDELQTEKGRFFVGCDLYYEYNLSGFVNAVYIPPNVDELTDEEDSDENLLMSEEQLDGEIAGTLELDFGMDGDNFDESDEEPLSEKRRRLLREKEGKETKWQRKEVVYTDLPISNEDLTLQDMKNALDGKTTLDIFLMFSDEQVLSMIVDFSLKYSRDNNRQDFSFCINDLKKILGILILTGYHVLPQADLHWSLDEDKSVTIVRNCMSRNMFRNIKRNRHLSDNENLDKNDKNDKFAKLRPFFDAINIRNKQFGIFAHNLSIDEQMVPYFGRHSCKMFIKRKPVRFGFKLWCLCSSDGYLFTFIPYAGANKEKEKSSLGGQIVIDLLSALDNP